MINYDFPNSAEDYVHRIGRTARADKSGTAYTFFTEGDSKASAELIAVMTDANQDVPDRLRSLASSAAARGGNYFMLYVICRVGQELFQYTKTMDCMLGIPRGAPFCLSIVFEW